MPEITTVGLDLAKHVVPGHGADASGHTVLRKKRCQTGRHRGFITLNVLEIWLGFWLWVGQI